MFKLVGSFNVWDWVVRLRNKKSETTYYFSILRFILPFKKLSCVMIFLLWFILYAVIPYANEASPHLLGKLRNKKSERVYYFSILRFFGHLGN